MTSPGSPSPTSSQPAIDLFEPGEDMRDTPYDRDMAREAPAFYDALNEVDELLRSRFNEHDARATKGMRRYRFGVFVTAWAGALAVLSAIAQLVFVVRDMHTAAHLAEKLEALLIVLALLGIYSGLRLSRLENWLVDRFKADQLRLLKFRTLLDPRIWGSNAERNAWRDGLLRRRDAILAVTSVSLAYESERDVLPLLPSNAECMGVDAAGLQILMDYYRRKRIDTQRRYFEGAASQSVSLLDRPRLLPGLFLISLGLVGVHVVIEQGLQRLPTIFDDSSGIWTGVSVVLVATAVSLLVLWAAIRTWRSASEPPRNVAHAAARRHMLSELMPLLERLQETDPAHALCQLQMLELVFESDQRESVRYMREVEWYS